MRIGKYRIGLWALSWRLGFIALLVMAFIPSKNPAPPEPSSQVSEPLVQGIADEQNLTFTIVQADVVNETRRILQCSNESCGEALPPANIDLSEVLFDGTWWYYYKNDALIRQNTEDGSEEIIKQTTDLVAPRSAVISPDGSKVAYWLDSRSDSDLTEIWIFDAIEGGSQVVAEKISKGDVLTRLRWNTSSTALIFLADNGEDNAEKIEPVVVNVAPAEIAARFTSLSSKEFTKEFTSNPLDIDESGTALAFTQSNSNATDIITVHDVSPPRTHTVNGTVPYVQWQPDGTLFYAAQVGSEITFWRAQGSNHIPINKIRGTFRSAHNLPGKNTIAFIADTPTPSLHTIDIISGEITDYAQVPSFGQYDYLVNATTDGASTASSVTAQLNDGQVTAFVQQHMPEIVEEEVATPIRILTTDQSNTVYVDYESEEGVNRILITIKDAIYPEWQVHGYYQTVNGKWTPVNGNSKESPLPERLYEWESDLQQWILKSNQDI